MGGGGDFGRLAKPVERAGECGEDGGQRDGGCGGDDEAVAERFAGAAGATGADGLRGADGDRREQADADQERHAEDRAGEGGRRQRHGAHLPDHDAVGEPEQNLTEVPGRDRQGQSEGRAQLAQSFTEGGHGSGETQQYGTPVHNRTTSSPVPPPPYGYRRRQISSRP